MDDYEAEEKSYQSRLLCGNSHSNTLPATAAATVCNKSLK
jgi:hypothetical protein